MKISNFYIGVKGLFGIFILIGFFGSFSAYAAPIDDFVTTWRTTTAGESITIPVQGVGYNYGIDCNNDGTFEQPTVTGNGICTFATAGDHTIRISPNVVGGFPKIMINGTIASGANQHKLRSVDQWGTNIWGADQGQAFDSASNLVINATDLPNFSQVTIMNGMFRGASSLTTLGAQGNKWDTSNVVDMGALFNRAINFNGDISHWNTSKVTTMIHMFWVGPGLTLDPATWQMTFNQDISTKTVTVGTGTYTAWDTSNVTSMNSMFAGNQYFNQPIGNWNTSKVTDMGYIFAGNTSFDQDISAWDVSKVTNLVAGLSYAGLSVGNYDKLLMAWATQPVQSGVLFGVDELQYCQGAAARNILKSTYSWNLVNAPFLFGVPLTIPSDGDSISCFPPIFQSISVSSNNVKNPAYAKSGDIVVMTLALSGTDTWKTGNVVDFTIGTGSLQTSSAFSGSPVAISNGSVSYNVFGGYNGTFTFSGLTFFDTDNLAITGYTTPYLPASNIIVDTINPVVTLVDSVATGPVQSDVISITVTDVNPDTASYMYGFSSDGACDSTDIPNLTNSFVSGSGFTIADETHNGQYLCVRVEDMAGNVTYAASTMKLYIDTTPPVVTLIGSGTITINQGSGFVDPGASWEDLVDGTGLILTATSGSVNTSIPGTYVLEYTYTDTAGNTGNVVTRIVNVVDGIAPVITISGSVAQTIEAGTPWSDPGASCVDNVDASCTVVVSGSVNVNVPGVYVIEYTATDSTGNVSILTRTITVVDTTPPVVTLIGSGTITINQGSGFVDPGASWEDLVDGTGLILTATSGSVNTSIPGTYVLEYTYTDTAGNTGNVVTRTVVVNSRPDTTVITSPGGTQYIGGGNSNTQPNLPTVPESPTVDQGPADLSEVLNYSISSDTCFTPMDKSTIDQGAMTDYQKIAHQMLYSYGLTTIPGTLDYGPARQITRAEAAKFFVQFAQNVLCRKKINVYNNRFIDIKNTHPHLQTNIILSYEYGIFYGYEGGLFKPDDFISRDEIIATIVRLVTAEYNDAEGVNWADNYKKILSSRTTVSLDSTLRANTAEVVYNLYKNNDYLLEDIGYVLK